jgi:hypothetical protein
MVTEELTTVWIATTHSAHQCDAIEGIFESRRAAESFLRDRYPTLREPTDDDDAYGEQFVYDEYWSAIYNAYLPRYAAVRSYLLHPDQGEP